MTFQAYLDNIRAKTGKAPEQLKALAKTAGVYIWAVFKDKGWVESPKGKTKT